MLDSLFCLLYLLISLHISYLFIFLSWNLSDFFRSNSFILSLAVLNMPFNNLSFQ